MTYLLGAILLAAGLAWLVVWWHRRPKSMAKGIDDFQRARQALAPPPPGREHPRGDGSGRDDPGRDRR